LTDEDNTVETQDAVKKQALEDGKKAMINYNGGGFSKRMNNEDYSKAREAYEAAGGDPDAFDNKVEEYLVANGTRLLGEGSSVKSEWRMGKWKIVTVDIDG
jgi:hypothetical protein